MADKKNTDVDDPSWFDRNGRLLPVGSTPGKRLDDIRLPSPAEDADTERRAKDFKATSKRIDDANLLEEALLKRMKRKK